MVYRHVVTANALTLLVGIKIRAAASHNLHQETCSVEDGPLLAVFHLLATFIHLRDNVSLSKSLLKVTSVIVIISVGYFIFVVGTNSVETFLQLIMVAQRRF